MQLTWLGTGTINTYDNFHTNSVLLDENTNKRLLLDCGGDIRFSLREQGLTYNDIDSVYISHLHGDHCGGLEWLGFCRFFDPSCVKPTLYISKSLRNDLWNNVLSGGMRSLQGMINTLDTYFDVIPIEKNGSFIFGNADLQLVQSIHIMDGFALQPCFGLIVTTAEGKKIYFTFDSQFCPEQITDFYDMADVIYHDCEITEYKSRVHANYQDLITLPDETRKKMRLTHFQDGERPDAEADGFWGFVEKGNVFGL